MEHGQGRRKVKAGAGGMERDRMKIRLEQILEGEEEVILRYRERTKEVEDLIQYLSGRDQGLICRKDGMDVVVKPDAVIYLESVDGGTFVYTEKEVLTTGLSLAVAEERFARDGFFRCSKSMVINVCHVDRLKSESGNRIDAQMGNGEHVMISRRYAKALRRILKGERA